MATEASRKLNEMGTVCCKDITVTSPLEQGQALLGMWHRAGERCCVWAVPKDWLCGSDSLFASTTHPKMDVRIAAGTRAIYGWGGPGG